MGVLTICSKSGLSAPLYRKGQLGGRGGGTLTLRPAMITKNLWPAIFVQLCLPSFTLQKFRVVLQSAHFKFGHFQIRVQMFFHMKKYSQT